MTENQEKTNSSIISSTYEIVEAKDQKLALSPELLAQAERGKDLFEEPRGENTKDAYGSDWRGFEAWAKYNKLPPEKATPEVVALYFAYLRDEGLAVATIDRAYCGISRTLKMTCPEHWPDAPGRPPIIRTLMSNLRRQNTRAVDRKDPMTTDLLLKLYKEDVGNDLIEIRNKALLLIGFGAALRRSELVGINREHMEKIRGDIRIYLPFRKTDQEGKGTWIGIVKQDNPKVCPVLALSKWLHAAREHGYPIDNGPIFRPIHNNVIYPKRLDVKQVVRAVKTAAERLGLDPMKFGAHSLRAGLATSAAINGVSVVDIQAQTGHASLKQLATYIRPATVFISNATRDIFKSADDHPDDEEIKKP